MDYDKGRIAWADKARIKANFLFRIACFAYCLGLFSLFLSIGMLMAPFDVNWFALSFILLSFLNLLQDKSFHMLAITIGLFNGLYSENKVKNMEYPNTSQNDPSHRNSMHHHKAYRH